MTNYTYSQLKQLWTEAGGSASYASMAAAVAMAESGGRSDAVGNNTNGTVDRGLWQINSIHGSLSSTDPIANARAAVQISNNGTNWRPWCTVWSNGACGGTFQGEGAPYKKFLTGGDAGSDAGGSSGTPAETAGLETTATSLNPEKWVDSALRTIGNWFLYGGMVLLGGVLMVVGGGLLFMSSDLAKKSLGAVTGVVSRK